MSKKATAAVAAKKAPKLIWKIIVTGTIAGLIMIALIIVHLEANLPSVELLRDVHLQIPLKIYTADGKLLAEYGDKRRTPVKLEQVPQRLIEAIIATEDRRFYGHPGVDLRGILRAAVNLISKRNKEQGGSTITMQVARNFFLTRNKTFTRKLNEILLALKIEQELTKEEILELYLNKIYFGKRAYGVAAAAEVYYGTTVDKLTLGQMAMLAGLPQAPSSINPLNSPENALKRRTHVLERMRSAGYISHADFEAANQETINTVYHGRPIEIPAPFVAEMVRQNMVEAYGENAYDSGYQVFTTIDSKMQLAANAALARAVQEYSNRHSQSPQIEGALVAMDPHTGEIKALVGGVDYEKNGFNRATQATRQPGSSFKPFIYAAALENGFTPASIINDAPVMNDDPSNEDWRPQNHTKQFYGPTRLRVGLTYSRNLVSIRLLQSLGVDKAIDFISRLGINESTLPRGLSLALGTNGLSPLELTAAYCVFPNSGYKAETFLIQRIQDSQAREVYTKQMSAPVQVMSAQTAYLVTSMLQDVVQHGTGRNAKRLGRTDIAGKTGTTNDQYDGWFTGYNRDLVVTTWMGFDEPKSIREYAANTALPMWIYFMENALQGTAHSLQSQPPGLVSVRIDPKTGMLARPGQEDAIYELFRNGTQPTQIASGSNDQPQQAVDDSLLDVDTLF